MYKVFIDGQVGTTGLQIIERLKQHKDFEFVEIPFDERKNHSIKSDYLNSSDAVILCLPDAAAIESVQLIENKNVRVLDASTAHRTDEQWIYGLPEMSPQQRNKIKDSQRVSVPGCYPTGFILAMKPLVDSGIISPDNPVSVNAVSGYSGGGRKLIEAYKERENAGSIEELWSYRPYGLSLSHKHLPEMQKYSGLTNAPVFVPSVGHFLQGMLVQIPLSLQLLSKGTTIQTIVDLYREKYENEPFINVFPANFESELDGGFLSPTKNNGTNRLDLFVFGHDSQALIIARLDNLGKGASGAAVQNLNLMLGIKETEGLV